MKRHRHNRRLQQNFVNSLSNLLDKWQLIFWSLFSCTDDCKKSIIERPFGWGLNRYDKAFDYFNKTKTSKETWYQDYNNKDGTNNFIKLLVNLSFYNFIYIFIFYL